MILSNWSQMRIHFAAAGAAQAPNGLPEWPGPVLDGGTGAIDNASSTSLLRVNGFSGTLRATSAGGFAFPATLIGPLVDPSRIPDDDVLWPFTVTCNAGASDAVTGVHEYSWYLSQRKDVGRWPKLGTSTPVEFTILDQILNISMPNASKSGTVAIALNLVVAGRLLPGLTGDELLTSSAFTTIFRHVHLYVRRHSDGAYQWARVYLD